MGERRRKRTAVSTERWGGGGQDGRGDTSDVKQKRTNETETTAERGRTGQDSVHQERGVAWGV